MSYHTHTLKRHMCRALQREEALREEEVVEEEVVEEALREEELVEEVAR